MHGNANENYHPWIRKQLGAGGGHRVFTPQLQKNGVKLSLANWLKAFGPYSRYVGEDAIFIARSLGPAFALRVLEKSKVKVRACFLIAGFSGPLGGKDDWERKTFFAKKFDWRKIRSNCRKFVVLASDNDPYVALAETKKLARKLGVKAIVVKGAGHFNTKSGYVKFPLLLKLINRELKNKPK
ncbi:alpha/beta hydrolase [Candidatus Micrarchaeota archaeon]|nr:alpha/beta hydrolase [Candidatus Micrarchaeota archaeon]